MARPEQKIEAFCEMLCELLRLSKRIDNLEAAIERNNKIFLEVLVDISHGSEYKLKLKNTIEKTKNGARTIQ